MWDVVRTFWCGLPPQVQAAVIGALTTVSSAIIGLYVVFWQIGRQARNAIGQNRHNETLKLKLKIYEEIVAISRDSSDAEIALSSFVRGFQTDIFLSRQMILSSLPSLIPKARAPVLLEKKSTLGSQTIKIISVTERWQIIDPRIEIFRTAINVANYDIDAAFQAYFSAAIRLMPHEMPSGHPQQGTVIPWSPPNDQVSQQFERVGQDVINALMNLVRTSAIFRLKCKICWGESYLNRHYRRASR